MGTSGPLGALRQNGLSKAVGMTYTAVQYGDQSPIADLH